MASTVRSSLAVSAQCAAAVRGLLVGDTSCLLTYRVAGAPADADVALPAVPDHAAAARLRGALRRVAWVAIDLDGASVRCEVAGVQRRPLRLPVPLATALALLDGGAPGVVRVADGGAA